MLTLDQIEQQRCSVKHFFPSVYKDKNDFFRTYLSWIKQEKDRYDAVSWYLCRYLIVYGCSDEDILDMSVEEGLTHVYLFGGDIQ